MNEVWLKIALALISILSALVTGFLVPYIKSKTTNEQLANMYSIVKFAVQAAEQIFIGSGNGQKKKEYVLGYLNSIGIKITEEDLNLLIESAVKELNIIQNNVTG